MSTIVRVQKKGQVTLPTRLRSQAGITDGDLVEARFQRGKIILTPKVVIDRSKFPTADDEYTPAQRRVIDARLVESAEDVKKGRTYGPFDTANEAIKFLHKEIKARKSKRKTPQR
jgi:AbrB family looped-hinge helix DNA binding protein